MPIGTPFPRTHVSLCESLNYRDWSGYYTVSAYETHHEHEYNAIRNAAALIDISPLFKYLVTGPDASRLVDRVITRDVARMDVGQVFYTPWCDEQGMVIDDGTVSRLDEQRFRWTSADPTLRWFTQNAAGLRVDDRRRVRDDSRRWPCRGRWPRACCVRRPTPTSTTLQYFRVRRRTHCRRARGHLADWLHRRSRLRDLDAERTALWTCGMR